MITATLIIALASNGLVINPGYQWLINKLKLNIRPFNCVYCLAWWFSIIFIIIQAFQGSLNPYWVAIPLIASFLAAAINRWFDNQPVRFK